MATPDWNKLVWRLPPDIRAVVEDHWHRYSKLFEHPDVQRSLNFILFDGAPLENGAHTISKKAAQIINTHRAELNELSAALANEPGIKEELLRESPQKILRFLQTLCDDDGVEACSLHPQIALDRLRENGEQYREFITHTYTNYCLADLVAEDCANAFMLFLEFLKEDYIAESRNPANYIPRQAVRDSLSYDFDTMYQSLRNDMIDLKKTATQIMETHSQKIAAGEMGR